jgi:hypothetical protein
MKGVRIDFQVLCPSDFFRNFGLDFFSEKSFPTLSQRQLTVQCSCESLVGILGSGSLASGDAKPLCSEALNFYFFSPFQCKPVTSISRKIQKDEARNDHDFICFGNLGTNASIAGCDD